MRKKIIINKDTVGYRLQIIRDNMCLSQEEFGKIFGLEWYKIKDIEIGKTRIKENIANYLAKEKKVNLNWLLAGEGDMYIKKNTAGPSSEEAEAWKNKYIVTYEKLEQVREELDEYRVTEEWSGEERRTGKERRAANLPPPRDAKEG